MDKPLGQLKSVDLRNRWSNEALDFTPWLAKEENISLLGEAMGLELEGATNRNQVQVLWRVHGKDTRRRHLGTEFKRGFRSDDNG